MPADGIGEAKPHHLPSELVGVDIRRAGHVCVIDAIEGGVESEDAEDMGELGWFVLPQFLPIS